MTDRVSILIPTRDRASSLKRLLESLQSSTSLDDTELEIIVINNHSTDGTLPALIEAPAEKTRFPIRVIEQSKRGKSWALNLGLRQASGSVFLLLDDDVVVEHSCVAVHATAYKRKIFDAVQGKVLPGRDPEGQSADMSRRCAKRWACLILGSVLEPLGSVKTRSIRGAFARPGLK